VLISGTGSVVVGKQATKRISLRHGRELLPPNRGSRSLGEVIVERANSMLVWTSKSGIMTGKNFRTANLRAIYAKIAGIAAERTLGESTPAPVDR
jgi:hypothetical protein